MIPEAKQRLALRAHIRAFLRRRALVAALTRLLPFSLAALCLWLAPQVFPVLPVLPVWIPLLVPFLALWRRPRRFPTRVRHLDRVIGLDGLLCAALEAPASHPFAPALTGRAQAALAVRSDVARASLFAPARYQRPRGLLVALLAFLLFLHLAGPLPIPAPWSGPPPDPFGLVPPDAGPGPRGPGVDPRSKPGQDERRPEQPQAGPESSPEPPRPEPEQESPAPPSPFALQPGEQEKLALTPPPAGEGPKHLKPVYETEGLLPPPAPAPSGSVPREASPDPARLAKELTRAAERALGDGLLTPGEAWMARRQAEALGR